MVPGVIIRTASIAERHPAAPADIPRPIMEITATPPVRGVNIPIRSIVARKPAQLAKHPVKNTPTMWMPTAMESATIAARPFR